MLNLLQVFKMFLIISEYNKNPFNSFGKNKKASFLKTLPTDTKSNDSNRRTMRNLAADETDHISSNRRIDTSKNQFDNIESMVKNLNSTALKHTKHSKKKKHKKHHRKSTQKSPTTTISIKNKEAENILNQNTKIQGFNYNEIISNRENHTIESEITKCTLLEKTSSKCLFENMKNEINGVHDDDSTSNVACETYDEVKHTKIDYNSGKGSKIAAFLPERQLWGWLGQTYRKAGLKGRAKKQFYKSISRGKETITVGECAVFLSTGRPDRPYVGRIEALWETTSSNKIVRVRWFYHPEETIGCPSLKYPGALFDSPHEDENDVQTISHRCEVVEFSVYIAKFGSDSYDNNDIYYLSGYYNPRLQILTVQPEIPTLDETSLNV